VSPPRREAEPLESDERVPVGIGIGAFVIALIVLLILRDHIPGAHHWWIWTCVVGVVGGIGGFCYAPYAKRKRGIGG
jgi:hypothetical protein